MMKKALAVLLSYTAIISLAACGKNPQPAKGPEETRAVTEKSEESQTPATETSPEAMGETVTFKLADNQADGTPNVEGDIHFIELVKEYTNGTVEIELFNNGVLGDEASVVDMLQADTLDIARVSTNSISPTCPAFNVFGMPYVFASDEQKYKALDGEFGQKLTQKLLDDTGLVNLTYFVSGARSFYTSKKPINGVADMSGMKLRAQDDPVTIAMIEALGAAATPMNYSEVYSALETGVIDGAENDFTSYYSSGHYEVAPYYSLDMHTAPSSLLVMSAGSWNKLSDAQKDAVMKAAKDTVQFQRDSVDAFVKKSREAVEEAGCTIIEVDVGEFQQACSSVYDKYPELKEYLDLIK